jgi:transposase
MAEKQYRPWTPLQTYLLPPSPTEWLPEGHLAYFILEVISIINLREIELAIEAKDPRGERPYSPAMMLGLLVYGYCVGVFSSRKIARATYEDVAFRLIAGESHPHFTRINQFRLDHGQAFAGLFVQILRLCQEAGMVKLGQVALDGSKVMANASKHKAMSHQRMREQEDRLQGEVEALLKRADDKDRQEDELYGVGCEPEDLPAELKRRETRLARIREAKAALEKEAAAARAAQLCENAVGQWQKAANQKVNRTDRARSATRAAVSEQRAFELGGDDDDDDQGNATGDLPRNRPPHHPDGTPKPKAQRNFTDPDSRIMMKDGAVLQAYNAQIVVDSECQVILAEAVSNQAADHDHLTPMIERMKRNCQSTPKKLCADSGYFSAQNALTCEQAGIDAYIPPQPWRDPASKRRRLTDVQRIRKRMREKVDSPDGKAIYARRKVIAEPPLGQIKQAQGFRRFSQRGLAKVRNEWSFVCMTHNLLKLFRKLWVAASRRRSLRALALA